jgi:glycine/D-amino acid oxidase-like deaminating enzyme/nitrite reductase/ring-hydroxylating ferredoxin subunit
MSRVSSFPTADVTSGSKLPFWLSEEKQLAFTQLREEIPPMDVCIIGGGIAGISVAYNCAKEGLKVVVLEDGEIASGETGRSSAHVFSWLDDQYRHIEYLHGLKGAQMAADSHQQAVDWIERVCRNENIDCGFHRLDGYLMQKMSKMPLFSGPSEATYSEGYSLDLSREFEAAQRAGYRGVEMLPRAPIEQFNTGNVIRFPGQGVIQPISYMNGLAKAAKKYGANIYTHTKAVDFEGGEDMATIRTADGIVLKAKHLVMATNTPLNNKITIHAKMMSMRSYVIAAEIPEGAYTDALYWDTDDNPAYHYVRFYRNGSGTHYILVGGEDHKVGQIQGSAEERYTKLEKWARTFWPSMGPVRHKWSGQIEEPIDSLGYIGRNPGDFENVYIVTGDSGNGITNATIAGILIRDLITAEPNDWATLYDPSRISLRTIGTTLAHDLQINLQYKDHLTGGDIRDIEDLPVGCGGILRRGFHKYAVYRDEDGQIFECQATCPHLGGLVRWNESEKTFDCPVHGSRFDQFGKVINGPAKSDLIPSDKRVEETKKTF